MKTQQFPFKQASTVAMTLTSQSLNTYMLVDALSVGFIVFDVRQEIHINVLMCL